MGAVGFVVELISDSGIGSQSKKSNEAELRVDWSKAEARGPKMRARALWLTVLGLALYAWTIGAPIAEAQVIRGTIRDARTSEPVMLAYVGLLAPGRELVVAGLADRYGDFSLHAPTAGSYFLYVARMGYKSVVDGLFEVGEDGVFELQVGLTPAAIDLEDLVVEAEERKSKLELVGFLERAAIGRGTFLIGEDIQAIALDKITDAFRNIPGLYVVTTRPLVGAESMRNPEIRIRRGGGECSPTLYVDGAIMALGSQRPESGPDRIQRGVRPDDFVTPASVEAVEIYVRPSETPLQYEARGRCGVVLIWTYVR